MAAGIYRRTEQKDILKQRGMKQIHGTHPASTVHKYPLCVLTGQDVILILKSQTLLDVGKRQFYITVFD